MNRREKRRANTIAARGSRARQSCALLLCSLLCVPAHAQRKRAPQTPGSKPTATKPATQSPSESEKAREQLKQATREYRQSLDTLLELYRKQAATTEDKLVRLRGLYAEGLIARRDIEAAEASVADAAAQVKQTEARITEADMLLAEAEVEEPTPVIKPAPEIASNRLPSPAANLIRRTAYFYSPGTRAWRLTEAGEVMAFFRSRFGRDLPVSAFGQSATHDRLGLDHREAMDVGLHPDSAEGQALIGYLTRNGIPFFAFRQAVAGSATGAHIHVGRRSHRL